MKKIFLLFVLALAAFVCTPEASAYSKELQEYAKECDNEMGNDGDVAYDGNNLIFTFSPSFLSDESKVVFDQLKDFQQYAPIMASSLYDSLGEEKYASLARLLTTHKANLKIRLNTGPRYREFIITPDMMMNTITAAKKGK